MSSTNTVSDQPLVSFLYLLMRDHLPCGVVEEIARNSQHEDGQVCVLSNGHLGRYAQEIAAALTRSTTTENAKSEGSDLRVPAIWVCQLDHRK